MIEISQEEFGEKIREVISGKATIIGLCKELQTDVRTLIQKIIMYSVYDKEVYAEFVEKHPYRTREREDIDFEALAIKILKQRMNSVDAAKKYNVGIRTIQRKVEKLKETNPELVEIYREAKQCNKKDQPYPYELEQKIDALVARPVIIGEINGQTEKRLEEIERIYNERMMQYSTKEEAAKSMGFTPNRLYKMLNQLYRIKIEKVQQNEFRKSLEVNVTTDVAPTVNENGESGKVKEGEEK